MPRRLLLIRHCQSQGNADGRLEGRGDSPLSEAGREQAKRVAAFVAAQDIGPATLIASPQSRAMWTSFFGNAPPPANIEAQFAYGMAGGTMVLPPSSGEAARRLVTPPPAAHPSSRRAFVSPAANSTFGHATGEFGGSSRSVPRLRPSRAPLFIGIGVIAVGGAVVGIMQLGDVTSSSTRTNRKTPSSDERRVEQPPPEPPTFRVEIETDPRVAKIELDGRPVGSGSLDQRLPSDGTDHVIVARSPGYREVTVHFVDRSPPHLLTLDPVPAAQPNPPTAKADSPSTNISPPSSSERGGDRSGKAGRRNKHAAVEHDAGRSSGKKKPPADDGDSGNASSGVSPKKHGDSTTANGAPIID